MDGQHSVEFVESLREGGFDRGGHPEMEFLPRFQQDRLIGHFLDKGVDERIFELLPAPPLLDQLGLLGNVEAAIDPGDGLRHFRQDLVEETPADHRRDLEKGAGLLVQPVDPRHQDLVDGLGDDHGVDSSVTRNPPSLSPPLPRR